MVDYCTILTFIPILRRWLRASNAAALVVESAPCAERTELFSVALPLFSRAPVAGSWLLPCEFALAECRRAASPPESRLACADSRREVGSTEGFNILPPVADAEAFLAAMLEQNAPTAWTAVVLASVYEMTDDSSLTGPQARPLFLPVSSAVQLLGVFTCTRIGGGGNAGTAHPHAFWRPGRLQDSRCLLSYLLSSPGLADYEWGRTPLLRVYRQPTKGSLAASSIRRVT